MKQVILKSVALALLLAGLSEAKADLIIGNLNGNDGTQTFGLGGSDLRIKAMGFTMPLGTDYSLDSVTLRLDASNALISPVVRVFDNDPFNNPGSPLITLTNPSFTPGIHNFVFTPPSSFTLAEGTTYWLVVHGNQPNLFDWKANDPGIVPTGIATHFGAKYDDFRAPLPPTTNSPILNSYAINGTAIPEPSTLTLCGLGILGLVGHSWRRSRVQRERQKGTH